MNVYDFDQTIYNGDSTIKFYYFCIKKRPIILFCIPRQIFAATMYLLNIYSKKKFKEKFYCFFKYIPNIDKFVDEFWKREYKNINNWYLKQKENSDVIISASPSFLLKKATNMLDISTLIASEVNKHTGKYIGNNCYGEEKAKRFLEHYPNSKIENFYSDSFSDQPMADLSENAYIVCKEGIFDWTQKKQRKSQKKFKESSLQFFRYGFWGLFTTMINLLFFYVLTENGVFYLLANIISYYVAVLINYLTNFYLVFEMQHKSVHVFLKKLLDFLLLRSSSLFIDSGIFFILVTLIGFDKYICRVCLSVFIIIINFFWSKRKIFVKAN